MAEGHVPLGILKKRLIKLSEVVAKRTRAGEPLGIRKPKKAAKKSHKKSSKKK
jgi:hypothetical protein